MFERLKAKIVYDEGWFGQFMTLPIQVVIWAILVVPFVIAIYLSFVDWTVTSGINWWDAPFAGVRNYVDAVTDPRLQRAFLFTVAIVTLMVTAEFVLGLALGVFFHRRFPAKRLYTSISLFPMMLPWVVVGLIFFLLFIQAGPVNSLLRGVFGPDAAVNWFGRPILASATIVIADVWQWTPFIFLVVYSGLGAVPPQPVEAAKTLGASEWQILRHVTLPAIRSVLLIALIIRGLEAFKIFDKIFIMTGGGPGTSTESVSIYLYRTGFVFGRLSFTSAAAILLLVFVTVVSWVAVTPLRGEVEV